MISKRIQAVAAFIPPAKTIADIGCDHGYLIIEAFINHNISYAIAIDNEEKPLAQAKRNILPYSFYNNVRFSLSNGLSDLNEAVDVIILSGIGGINALDIIKNNIENIKGARLIIQAARNLYNLRLGLNNLGFSISREEIIKDSNHFYEIIEFIPNSKEKYNKIELTFGPCFLKQKPKLFLEKLNKELKRLKSIAINTKEITEKIMMIEEILCKLKI